MGNCRWFLVQAHNCTCTDLWAKSTGQSASVYINCNNWIRSWTNINIGLIYGHTKQIYVLVLSSIEEHIFDFLSHSYHTDALVHLKSFKYMFTTNRRKSKEKINSQKLTITNCHSIQLLFTHAVRFQRVTTNGDTITDHFTLRFRHCFFFRRSSSTAMLNV